MFVKSLVLPVLLTAIYVPYAFAAVVSLYIPDGDGAPFTADPIGTDDSGHTTWLLDIGAASGTFTATQGAGTPATLVAGATDIHVFGGQAGASARVDCAFPSPTASGAPVVASCVAQLKGGSTTLSTNAPPVTLTPLPVQVSDGKSGTSGKSNGAGRLRLSLGGVAVSALAILGTAGVMLVRM